MMDASQAFNATSRKRTQERKITSVAEIFLFQESCGAVAVCGAVFASSLSTLLQVTTY